jgi:hypothetical protein
LFPIIYSFSRYWFVEREVVGAAALKQGPRKKQEKNKQKSLFQFQK